MKKIFVVVLILGFFFEAYATSPQPAERDLSRYDSVGPFELNFTGAREQWSKKTAEVRDFLWTHWRNKRLARAAINYTSREGVPHPVTYFVEPCSSGWWNIVIEAQRRPPGGPVSERRFIAVVVQRIVARDDGLQPEVAIPHDVIVEAERYELLLKDSQGKTVNIL